MDDMKVRVKSLTKKFGDLLVLCLLYTSDAADE